MTNNTTGYEHIRLEYNPSKGTSRRMQDFVKDMDEAKEKALVFLKKEPRGSVEVKKKGYPLTIFYLDVFTKMQKEIRQGAYIIAHNVWFPYSNANTLAEARVKACAILKKEREKVISIFKYPKNSKTYGENGGDLKYIGFISFNGKTFKYIDESRNYTTYILNPLTGAIKEE